MIEPRYGTSVDSRRYVEVVEVQRDGRPRMHISENLWSRFNMFFDLHHNIREGSRMTMHGANVPIDGR